MSEAINKVFDLLAEIHSQADSANHYLRKVFAEQAVEIKEAKKQIDQAAAKYEECEAVAREAAALCEAAKQLMGKKDKVSREGHE